MKTVFLGSLLLTSTAFAQNIDIGGLKQLLTANQSVLESVNVGMSKKVTTFGKIKLSTGDCNYMLTSTQSILKIENSRILVLAKEKFSPATTPACRAGGYVASNPSSILSYEDKPSLSADLADLNVTAPSISSINQAGSIVTLNLSISETNAQTGSTYTDKISVQYDLTKSSFKNTILNQGNDYKTTSEDIADIDVRSVDLKKVLFCENNDGDTSECIEGDYSDILL